MMTILLIFISIGLAVSCLNLYIAGLYDKAAAAYYEFDVLEGDRLMKKANRLNPYRREDDRKID